MQLHECMLLRTPPAKNKSIWLLAYYKKRAIYKVKRGHVSSFKNTYEFQTAFDSHRQFLRYRVSKLGFPFYF